MRAVPALLTAVGDSANVWLTVTVLAFRCDGRPVACEFDMTTTDIVSIEGHQAVKLPDEYRFRDSTVSIRREGEAVILEPVQSVQWPPGFFEAIRIADPAFTRPSQGPTPPVPTVESR